jgi:carbonic anhydrase
MTPETRRPVLIAIGVALTAALAAVVVLPGGRGAALARPAPPTPEAALAELRAGNARYVASHRTLSTDTAHDADERRELARGQHPFAAVLGCADSRVCPEFVFDQRPGAMFDIRNAGNVVDDDVMGSLEYAVEHFHVRVVLVLGHKGCGAIEAVHGAGEKPLHDHLRALQDHMACIRPQLRAAHEHTSEVLNWLSAENARGQAATLLKESEPLNAAVGRGEVRLVSGIYDMETGEVEFFAPGGN